MIGARFSIGTVFVWFGQTYEVERILPDKTIQIEEITGMSVRIVEMNVLVQALFEGHLVFQKSQVARVDDKPTELRPMDAYSESQLEQARKRLEIITPLLDINVSERTRGFVETLAKSTGVGIASIYRWLKCYETSGNDLRALVPLTSERGGKNKSRSNEVVDMIIEAVIKEKYLVREKVTIDDVHAEIAVRISEENRVREVGQALSLPSRATVARRIEKLDVVEKFAARHGKTTARRVYSQYGSSEKPSMPLERVEIDTTRLDLMVLDGVDDLPIGRLTLSHAVDVATRLATRH